jgi:uncharacterized membrane protein YdjX (TVP38/TMEM64 family)
MRSRRLAVVAALLLAAVAAILLLPRDTDTWLGLVAAAGIWAPLLFVAVWVPATCLLFPGPVLYVLAVALFGPAGIALCLVGSPLGALAAFAIARGLAPASLADRLPARARAVAARLERSGPWSIALVRSTPGLPACAFNYACGLARVRPRAFVVGIAVGAAPRIVLYGVLGGAALNGNPIVATVGAAGIVVSLGVALGRRRLRIA